MCVCMCVGHIYSTALEALQMEAVTLVLITSLVAHLYFWPYKATLWSCVGCMPGASCLTSCEEDAWNRAEIGLLIVSLTITGMTTCIIAAGLHSR